MADMRKMLLTMHPNTKALAKAFANNILAGVLKPPACTKHLQKYMQQSFIHSAYSRLSGLGAA